MKCNESEKWIDFDNLSGSEVFDLIRHARHCNYHEKQLNDYCREEQYYDCCGCETSIWKAALNRLDEVEPINPINEVLVQPANPMWKFFTSTFGQFFPSMNEIWDKEVDFVPNWVVRRSSMANIILSIAALASVITLAAQSLLSDRGDIIVTPTPIPAGFSSPISPPEIPDSQFIFSIASAGIEGNPLPEKNLTKPQKEWVFGVHTPKEYHYGYTDLSENTSSETNNQPENISQKNVIEKENNQGENNNEKSNNETKEELKDEKTNVESPNISEKKLVDNKQDIGNVNSANVNLDPIYRYQRKIISRGYKESDLNKLAKEQSPFINIQLRGLNHSELLETSCKLVVKTTDSTEIEINDLVKTEKPRASGVCSFELPLNLNRKFLLVIVENPNYQPETSKISSTENEIDGTVVIRRKCD